MLKFLTRLLSGPAAENRTPSTGKLPYQPKRQTNTTNKEHEDFRRHSPKIFDQVGNWQMRFGDRAQTFTFPGICEICDAPTEFRADPRPGTKAPFGYAVNWWAGTKCAKCKLMMRDRALARVLLEQTGEDASVYQIGHHSHLRTWLGKHFPRAVCTQFGLGSSIGSTVDGFRMDDLSMPDTSDASYDAVIVADVLEHVPDHLSALSAMARVLKNGGRAVLALP